MSHLEYILTVATAIGLGLAAGEVLGRQVNKALDNRDNQLAAQRALDALKAVDPEAYEVAVAAMAKKQAA